MKSIAQAWDRDNIVLVDVISVYGGEWVVSNQWTSEQYVADPSRLTGLWIESEIVDTFDEFVKNFGIADSFFMVAAITKNSAWAERIAWQWANLY